MLNGFTIGIEIESLAAGSMAGQTANSHPRDDQTANR